MLRGYRFNNNNNKEKQYKEKINTFYKKIRKIDSPTPETENIKRRFYKAKDENMKKKSNPIIVQMNIKKNKIVSPTVVSAAGVW